MLAGHLQAATADAVLVFSNRLDLQAKEDVVERYFAGNLDSDSDWIVKEVPSGLSLVHCSAWEGPQLRALTSIIAKMADAGDPYNCIDTSTFTPEEKVFAKRWMAQAATPEVASTIAQDGFKFWFTCDAVMRFEKDGKTYTARLPDNPKEMKPLYNSIGAKPPLSKEEMAAQVGF